MSVGSSATSSYRLLNSRAPSGGGSVPASAIAPVFASGGYDYFMASVPATGASAVGAASAPAPLAPVSNSLQPLEQQMKRLVEEILAMIRGLFGPSTPTPTPVPGPGPTPTPSPTPTPAPTPSPTPGNSLNVPIPTHGALLGMEGAQATGQAEIGRKTDITSQYYQWTVPFPTANEKQAIQNGQTPLIHWNGTHDLDGIASGKYDDMIRARATAVKDLGSPVFLRWFWEMDGHQGARAGGLDPQKYVAAWQHIHDIFDQQGAKNVSWVWCPNTGAFKNPKPTWATASASAYYPGDRYVDWIGADGYSYNNVSSVASEFADMYQFGQAHNKPMMIGETGAVETTGTAKADWIRQLGTTVQQQFPNIKAMMWFNLADWVTATGQHQAFAIDSSPSSQAAFKDLAQNPYFNTQNR